MNPIKEKKNKNLAIARGKRLKLCRVLAELTRKKLYRDYDLNPNTIASIESGANLLTEKRAKQLVEIFNKEGVPISLEWLLQGVGDYLLSALTPENKKQPLETSLDINEALSFFDEIKYFNDTKRPTVVSMITDDALAPIFNMGDYVGGIKKQNLKEIQTLVGEFCILLTDKNQIIVAKIFNYDKEKNRFTVGSINPLATTTMPNYFECRITEAAKITRHWLGEKIIS